jgi:isopentenyl-diphosphate Delta-isomerase
MPKVTPTSSRKADHIHINLREDVRSAIQTGLERFRFIHQALPEIDLDSIDLCQNLLVEPYKPPS